MHVEVHIEGRGEMHVKIIELSGCIGLVIYVNNKRIYIPPLLSNQKIVLPLKYKDLISTEVFPEIEFKPYGRA